MGNGITTSLEQIKRGPGRPKIIEPVPIEVFRQIWRDGQQRGKIVIIDGPQDGEDRDVKCGLVVSTADRQMIRVAMTKQEAVNLSRALLEAVT